MFWFSSVFDCKSNFFEPHGLSTCTRGRNIGSRLVDVVMTGGNRREGTTRPGGSHCHRHRHRGLLWHHRLTTSRHGAVLESQCVKKSADSVVCVFVGWKPRT